MASTPANGRSKAASGPGSSRCRSDQIQVRSIGLVILATSVSGSPLSSSALSQ